MRYLLSTGKITTRIEYYILDLIRLNLTVLPKDPPVPNSTIGFDYSMSGITKDRLQSEVRSKINLLINKILDRFSGIDILLTSLSIIDEANVNLVISVNSSVKKEFNVNIYQLNL